MRLKGTCRSWSGTFGHVLADGEREARFVFHKDVLSGRYPAPGERCEFEPYSHPKGQRARGLVILSADDRPIEIEIDEVNANGSW